MLIDEYDYLVPLALNSTYRVKNRNLLKGYRWEIVLLQINTIITKKTTIFMRNTSVKAYAANTRLFNIVGYKK